MITDNVFALYDTLDSCKNGDYTKEENKIKLKLSEDEQRISKVLLPDEVRCICENPTIKEQHVIGRIGHFCVNEDSFSVARRIKQSHSEEKVLVWNQVQYLFRRMLR